MAKINLSRLDAVMEDVSSVRLALSQDGPLPDYKVRQETLALAEAVAELVDVVRDKLAELGAKAG